MIETAAVTSQRFRRRPEIDLKLEDQRGTIRCGYCGREWDHNNNGNMAEAHRQFEEHLPECRPGFQPRSIEEIKREIDRERNAAKKKQGEEKERAERASREAQPRVLRPRKMSQPCSKGPQSKQPNLTDEMIDEMKRLYVELRRIQLVTDRRYASFGFSSSTALREAIRERKIALGVPQHRRRITDAMAEEIKRLHKTEGLTVRAIAKRYYKTCGYSFDGFRNVIYEILKKSGLDPRENTKRPGGNKRKMTPPRINVAWQLYSLGNYTLKEISEMSRGFWDVSKSTIGESLQRRADHELRVGRWGNDGSRPISREEALELIKSVS